MNESNQKPVVVTAKNGTVVQVSPNNKEYGYIRVTQTRLVTENGFGRTKQMSALIPGKVADLLAFGWNENQEITGKIIAKESLKPFNPNNPEDSIKLAGESGIPCTVGGQPIYRKHEFTFNMNAEDVLIEHDNKEAIQLAYKQTEGAEAGVTGDAAQDFKV